MVALVLGKTYSTSEKIRHYELARREALRMNDEARADFLLSRLSQLGYHEQDRAEFEQALALMDDGQKDKAMEIIHRLAPEDLATYAPAHVYLAAALLDGVVASENPWPLIRKHAGYALELEPNQVLARRFIVESQLHDNQIDLAMEGMESLRRVFPDFNAELAHQYVLRNDVLLARKYASAAIKYWEELHTSQGSSTTLEFTPQGYLRFAECFSVVGDEKQEIALLRQSVLTHPDSAINRQAYVRRLGARLGDFSFENPERCEQLKDILIYDPQHEQALQTLFVPMTDGSQAAIALAKDILGESRAPAQLYKAVGDMFLTTEQLETAKSAYHQACEKDAQSAYAWNNLAWIYSNEEPVKLEKALECTERAIAAKNDPNFFETRGQILVKLQRWEEAARFLERALNGMIPNPQDAHRSLATIYTALGKPEQAAAHKVASGQ